jgi:hypothetical protein
MISGGGRLQLEVGKQNGSVENTYMSSILAWIPTVV